MHKIKETILVFPKSRMSDVYKSGMCKQSVRKESLNPSVELHSRGSASSVKRSARSATVSTAASDCFMAALLWLECCFFLKKINIY